MRWISYFFFNVCFLYVCHNYCYLQGWFVGIFLYYTKCDIEYGLLFGIMQCYILFIIDVNLVELLLFYIVHTTNLTFVDKIWDIY